MTIPKSWSKGFFRAFKGTRACFVVGPEGEKILLGFNASKEEDLAQAEFVAHACNTLLLALSPAKPAGQCPRCNGAGELTGLAGHNVSETVSYPCPVCTWA